MNLIDIIDKLSTKIVKKMENGFTITKMGVYLPLKNTMMGKGLTNQH